MRRRPALHTLVAFSSSLVAVCRLVAGARTGRRRRHLAAARRRSVRPCVPRAADALRPRPPRGRLRRRAGNSGARRGRGPSCSPGWSRTRGTSSSVTPAACGPRTRSSRRSGCARARSSHGARWSAPPAGAVSTTTATCCTSDCGSATPTSIRCGSSRRRPPRRGSTSPRAAGLAATSARRRAHRRRSAIGPRRSAAPPGRLRGPGRPACARALARIPG